MSDRILKAWTFQRWLYLVLGGIVIAQAAVEQQWMVMLAGGYFASMAIFNFGCAAGCYGGACSTGNDGRSNNKSLNKNLEDVKTQ
jgi:hypothetical protein